MSVSFRRSVLMGCGASEVELKERLSCTENPFEHPDAPISLPLEDDHP